MDAPTLEPPTDEVSDDVEVVVRLPIDDYANLAVRAQEDDTDVADLIADVLHRFVNPRTILMTVEPGNLAATPDAVDRIARLAQAEVITELIKAGWKGPRVATIGTVPWPPGPAVRPDGVVGEDPAGVDATPAEPPKATVP